MGNHRIVVVVDDVFIRLDLTMHVRSGGHAIVGTADSAAEAVRVVERKSPDLVLMDVRLLGDRDGIDAATEIWRRFAIRSLLVSANLDTAARVNGVCGQSDRFPGETLYSERSARRRGRPAIAALSLASAAGKNPSSRAHVRFGPRARLASLATITVPSAP